VLSTQSAYIIVYNLRAHQCNITSYLKPHSLFEYNTSGTVVWVGAAMSARIVVWPYSGLIAESNLQTVLLALKEPTPRAFGHLA
jgi:hypothetical protein